MDKEIRELFDKNNIITRKITIRHNVRIIDTGNDKFVIKKRDKDLENLFKYLSSRGFNYFPSILYKTDNYDVYKYIEGVNLPREEEAIDIVKLLSILHNKTTFYKDIDDDSYKEIYEDVIDRIDYLYNYYDDFANIIEREEYMSPSNYLFIRNISKIFQALNYSRINIDKWYNLIKSKKRVRIVNLHNNVSLDHYLLADKPYLISWRLSKKDMPIYDIINFYKKYYNELDFSELLRIYEVNYPLLKEEKILLFCLLSIPSKLEFTDNEYDMCLKVSRFYEYIYSSEKLIDDNEEKVKKDK